MAAVFPNEREGQRMKDDIKVTRGPSLGEPAPLFETEIAGNKIGLHDFRGGWVVLFTGPADVLPVFKTRTINYLLCKRKTKVIALGDGSTVGMSAGRNLLKKYILKHNLTIVDDSDGKIAAEYGLSSKYEGGPHGEKGVFIIDPKGILRVKLYLSGTGEGSLYEMLKLIDALQMTDRQKSRSSEQGGWRRRLNVVIRPKIVPGESSTG
jgi:peroxiredoxin (alkyl hydroperoxide reductase subunit C)